MLPAIGDSLVLKNALLREEPLEIADLVEEEHHL